MHIGFLTPEYPHKELNRSGGLGTSIKNLAEVLVKQGVKVTVFVSGQTTDKTMDLQGVTLLALAKRKHIYGGWYFERKRIQRWVQERIDMDGIELIEAPDWTGLTAFMRFSVPLVIRMHGSDGYFCYLEGREQKKKHRFLEKKALRTADALVSASTFTGKVTQELFGLKQNITTIYNSIDTSVFVPLREPVNTLEILYFGTLVRKKGVLELAYIFNKVVEQLPDAQLVLIGKDNKDVLTKQSTWHLFLEGLSSKAKLNVTHLNEVSYEKIKHYIAKAKVIVLPSFAEAFPMTWLETLAMEKPLVSSNIGWAKELMINGKTGYTEDPKNHQAYANKIIELLDDENLCERFGKAARQYVEAHFDMEQQVEKNVEFYKSVLRQC